MTARRGTVSRDYQSIDDETVPLRGGPFSGSGNPTHKVAAGLFAFGILFASAVVGGMGLVGVQNSRKLEIVLADSKTADVKTLTGEFPLSANIIHASTKNAIEAFEPSRIDKHEMNAKISEVERREETFELARKQPLLIHSTNDPLREVIDNGSLRMNVTTSGYPILQSTDEKISGYPWKYIVEPFKTTVFQVDGPTSVRNEGTYYTWEITEHNGKVTTMKGEKMFYEFREITKKSLVTVRKYDPSGVLIGIHSEEVMCKYVRREVRELLPADLKLLMDTMQIIWHTSSEDGRKLYGDRYQGIDFFNMKHISQGADPECNHFHEGPGFITQHLALTLEFEQALQSIEPSLSVPYWDFTIDAELYGADWSLYTPVLDDDVFGPGLSPSYVVNRGRWAYTSLGDYGTYFDKTVFHNSYGLLRPEWNNNAYPYLTRWHNIAGTDRKDLTPNDCDDYWQVLHDQTWSDFAIDANTRAHGFLHGLLGGVWYEYKDWYAEGLVMPVGSGLTYLKYFWREGYLQCPKYCSPDTPRSECRCHCNYNGQSWHDVLDDVNQSLSETVYKDLISKMYALFDKFPVEGYDSADDYLQYIFEGIVCDPGSIGDNFDSESTHDPTFWPMHPTFERLMHWMRLSPEPYEYNWGIDVYSCVGHNPQDYIPFKQLFLDDAPDSGDYTNEQLYYKLDPTSDMLPYVYSNFEWTHCESMGYDMSNEKLRSDLDQLKKYTRPNEKYEYSNIDWGIPWADQVYFDPPSVIIERQRQESLKG